MTEYRIIELTYGSGAKRYRIEKQVERDAPWEDHLHPWGFVEHFFTLRKAKKMVVALYGSQVREEKVVWP